MYADWLDEHDQPARAEFIRVQCELARTTDPARRDKLERRERHLWQENRRAFRTHLPDPLRGVGFRRGFPAPVLPRLSGKRFFASHFDRLPLAPSWEINLNSVSVPNFIRLFTDERMLRVAVLRVMSNSPTAGTLFKSPHARNLTQIEWVGANATAKDFRPLCDAEAFPHLVELSLPSSKIGDEGAKLLARSHHAARLTHLNLIANRVGPDGAAELARGGFVSLECLSLGYDWALNSGVGDSMVAELTTGSFPRLRQLRLFGLGLSDAVLRFLAAWPGAATLRRLDLNGGAGLGVSGVRALAASPFLRDLEAIDLMPPLAEMPEVSRILTEWLGEAVTIPGFGYGVRGRRPGVT